MEIERKDEGSSRPSLAGIGHKRMVVFLLAWAGGEDIRIYRPSKSSNKNYGEIEYEQ
jgi:hypothetical protein